MSAWVNIPASTSLLAEINAVGEPGRVKAQDGTVADSLHGSTSDHQPDEDSAALKGKDADSINEIHARDADSRGPWLPGWSMERIVQTVVARVRAGVEKRIRYIIYRKRIWHWVDGQFVQSVYDGDDPHELHAHFSFNYGSGAGTSNPENITSPWGILAAYEAEQDMAIDQADVTTIVTGFRNTGGKGILSDTERGFIAKAVATELAPQFLAVLNGVDLADADEPAIIAGVLAGLTPERLGQAITAAGLTPQALADALPDEMAGQVADILAARLAS